MLRSEIIFLLHLFHVGCFVNLLFGLFFFFGPSYLFDFFIFSFLVFWNNIFSLWIFVLM